MMDELNLLIIDDEIEVLNTLKRVFHKDYKLHITQSIEKAFDIMARVNVGVILCDQRMPEMKGTEFFTKVRELYPDTIRILITAYSELSDVITSINDAHIYRYITKPWNTLEPVSYTHLRAHETRHDLVCRLLLEKKKKKK